MAKKFLWKIGGEAGFGIMTTGQLFSRIAARMGYHIYDYFEYPSLIRGGHNTTETLISDEEATTSKLLVDILACLNEQTYELHKHRIGRQSIIIYDADDFSINDNNIIRVSIPIKKFLKENEGSMVMMNNVALGVSLALMGWDLTILNEMISQQFAKKGEEIISKNKTMALLGFDYILKNYKTSIVTDFPIKDNDKQLILTGNDAFSLGAIVADCRLYSAYPMTPSSSILTTLASYAEKTGMIVRHAEDEIAVINTALGSSWAGVRSAVGTSGGGFALMVEAISFAGIAEIPVVIFLGQRPGPATGMPTWTEQGDLLFATAAGHGEFPKIIIAPGDVEEMYKLTGEAFDLADIYQTPVIILSDKLLSESHQSTAQYAFNEWAGKYKPNRGKIVKMINEQFLITDGKYRRYKITDDGISPMLIPGLPGYYYQSNSYEHIEDGHTTEESKPRQDQVAKRNCKEKAYLKNHFKSPALYGQSEAKIVFVSWGGNKGAILEAIKQLNDKEIKSAYIHFTYLYPMDENKVASLFNANKRYILIENNSHGQFGRLLRQQTGINITEKLLKFDGRPIWAEEIVNYVINN